MSAADRSAKAMAAPAKPMRALWLAVLMAVLLAYSWQSFLVQTHRHFDGARVAGASAKGDVAGQQRQEPGSDPANCFLCRELAHAGHAVLPAPVLIVVPEAAGFWLAAVLLASLSLVQRTHGWRSRAPPLRLQA